MNRQIGGFSGNKTNSTSLQRSSSKSKDNVSPVKGLQVPNQSSNLSSSRKSPGQINLSLKQNEYATPIKGTMPNSTNSQSQGSYTNFDAINQGGKESLSTTNSTNRGKAQLLSNKSPLKSNSIAKQGVLNLQKDGSRSELNVSSYEKKSNTNININIQRVDQDGNELTVSQKYAQDVSGFQAQGDAGSNILDISQNQLNLRDDKDKKSSNQKSMSRLEDSPPQNRKNSNPKNPPVLTLQANSSSVSSTYGQKRESATFSLAKNILKRQNTNQYGGIPNSDKANQSIDKGLLNISVQQSTKLKNTAANLAAYNPEVATKERDGNVKVYARFRPNNNTELDLINQGLGSNIIDFNDEKAVTTMCDNQMYTCDRIFKPDSKQEYVYNTVAVEVVNDVLAGYNGTIFTYGVTGSGKTHTMFGKIQEEEMEGIIPRMCTQLFEHVENEELDIDYTINVSMLEIYKENLYDSLIQLSQGDKKDLKIKEHPQKGIIVDGLTQKQIAKEEELFGIIDYGYNSRQTRATRLNEYSSRSHTVFMVEIQQKLPNGSEKSGKLNLIDLAGSEKVNKSGAVGESLEEAIKINVSLTCLGKVIHALTTGQEYIPYRDSKLTRILQESLGGNYKTSLIVCCSMHSNFQDDTVSTLKFAQRAKTIKNTFKQNIKSSPESMKQAIEILKQEVFQAKNLLQLFHTNIADVKEGLQSGDPDKIKQINKALDKLLEYQTDYNPKQYELGALTDQAGRISALASGAGNLTGYAATGNASIDILIARVKNRDEEIASLKNNIVDLEDKNKNLENDILEMKQANIKMVSEVNDLKIEKNSINVKFNKEVSKNDFLVFQIEILQKQIQNLVDQVCKSEKRCAEYLQQKKKVIDEKIDNIMKDDLTFAEIKLSDYFNNSINFNYEFQIDRNSALNQGINLSSLTGKKKSIHASANQSSESSDSDSDSDMSQSFISSQVNTPGKAKSALQSQKSIPFQGNKPVLGIPNTSSFYRVGQGLNAQQNPPSSRDDGMKDSFLNNINFNNISNNPNVEMLKRIIEIPQKIDEASQKDPVSKDFMIINLKKALINAHIINQNLLRTISALEWKQIIEYGKSQLKSNVMKIQSKHIERLESVIEENIGNQKNLRDKMEEIEFELNEQKKEIKTTTSFSRLMPRKSRIMLPVPIQPRFQNAVQLVQKAVQIAPPRKDSVTSDLVPRDQNPTNSSQVRNTTEKTEGDDMNEIIDMIDKNVLPLTYENAIMELKKKNYIIKKLYQENLDSKTQVIPSVIQDSEKVNALSRENDRLRDKIISIQNDLKVEQAQTASYKKSLQVERRNLNNLRKLNQEMEISLRNNLREENEGWQSVINTIKEQNEKEMIKRQQDYNVLNEKLNDVLEKAMYKLGEMKTRGQTCTVSEIEQVIQELQKQKTSVSVNYENKSAKRRSLLFTPGMLPNSNTPQQQSHTPLQQQQQQGVGGNGINPHSPKTLAFLQTFAQQAQQHQ